MAKWWIRSAGHVGSDEEDLGMAIKLMDSPVPGLPPGVYKLHETITHRIRISEEKFTLLVKDDEEGNQIVQRGHPLGNRVGEVLNSEIEGLSTDDTIELVYRVSQLVRQFQRERGRNAK